MEEEYKSYAAWKKEGRVVNAGQKSHKRDENNVALFAHSQTKQYITKTLAEKPSQAKQRLDDMEDDIPF